MRSSLSSNSNIVIKPGAFKEVKIHKNTDSCPMIYEVTPVYGCEFKCIYCNALGQEKEEKFLPVNIDTEYPKRLRKVIEENQEKGENPIYYYCPKSDCFQDALKNTGITQEILELFKEKQCKYILVTKGVPNKEIFDLMVDTKEFGQIIITYGMPNEDIRKIVEPGSAPLNDRIELAKKCINAGIDTAAILEPFLPFRDLSFVDDIMKKFAEIGVRHFAIDFARVTHDCLERLVSKLPQYEEELRENYILENSHTEIYTTARGTDVKRYSPPKEYMLEKFMDFKAMAKKYDSTVSICNSFKFDEFNDEAENTGYICMGINIRKFDLIG